VIRRVLVLLLGVLLRVFFRRIEEVDAHHVPPEPRPVIFVLNHPNGLVDPLFILCLAPRRISFLAKSTIFKMPVLGAIARGIEALPVYRQQDAGEDTKKNAETFEAARALLARGGTIALFPEGTTHSDPALKPMKSGAARLALGARARLEDLVIVPAGLYYTDKETFRSAALVRYGPPLEVPKAAIDAAGEPSREDTAALTARIDEALRALTLNAEKAEEISLAARAERIFSTDPDEAGRKSVARELELRRRFAEGTAHLRELDPAALDALIRRAEAWEARLEAAGLDQRTLAPSYPAGTTLRWTLGRIARFVVLAPVGALGAVIHWPAYRMTGVLAARFSNDEDVMVATVKLLASLLLFPLTWGAAAVAAGLLAPAGTRAWAALATVVVLPLAGLIAVRFQELLLGTIAGARGFLFALARPRFFAQLNDERAAIRAEMVRLYERLEAARAAGGA